MANTLSIYDPIFYAQEALILLRKVLGLANRVYTGYSKDSKEKGSVISIRKPSTFAVSNAPSTAADIVASKVDITLDQWREVKFKLTDKELSFTKDDIIREHIAPAAYALADDLDQKLAALYKDVPWFFDVAGGAGSTLVLADVAAVRKVMFDNAVPMNDGMLNLMVGSAENAALLPLLAPYTQSGPQGAETLRNGTFGSLFGLNIFANQNTPSHTPGVSADSTGALTVATAIGTSSVTFDSVTAAGTFKTGDSFVIAGHAQRYVFTADATAVAGVVTGATFYPPAAKSYSIADVITIRLDTHVANIAFHRNAFALATAPLSEMGSQLGAQIASVADPVTGVNLRSRVYYVGNSSEVHVALDILYGVKTLDGNLAARLCG